MARGVIEATAKEKGITTGNLFAKIDELHTQGLIREHIREAAHEVRLEGNDIAHADLMQLPISIDEASEVIQLVDELLVEVYQSPARVARVRQARAARNNSAST